MKPSSLQPLGWRNATAIYILLGLLFCFLGLSNHGYISMEGMVEDGADHMLSGGSWWVPYVYDELYTYKPPLVYWLGVLPSALSDGAPPAWSFRAPFAVLGLGWGLAILWIVGRSLGPRTGLCCAVASTGTILFLEKVRIAEFDGPLTVLVGIAVVLAVENLSLERGPSESSRGLSSQVAQPSLPRWLLTYGFLFLAFLAKGAPAVMAFGPGLLLAAFAVGRFRTLFTLRHLLAAFAFVGCVGLFLYRVVGEVGLQALTQPADEAVAMGFTWSLYEVGRALVKPLLILVALAPFSIFLPRGVSLARSVREEDRSVSFWSRGALAFLVGGGAMFVIVPEHEMRYFLPLTGAGGLAFGVALSSAIQEGASRWERGCAWFFGVVAVLAIPVAVTVRPQALVVGCLGLVVVSWMLAAKRYGNHRSWVACSIIAFSVLGAVQQALVWVPRRAEKRDLQWVAEEFALHIPPEARVCTTGPADTAGKHASLFTYLNRDVYVLNPSNQANQHDWCVFVDQDWAVGLGLGMTRIAVIDHPYFQYRLGRVLPAADKTVVNEQ